MQYWAFCANPDFYRIMEAVQELEYDNFYTMRSDIRAGDKAIIWKAKGERDRNGHRGIIALADVVSDPSMQIDMHLDYQFFPPDEGTDPPVAEKVTVRYLRSASLPLWVEDHGPEYNLLTGLAVAKAHGGGVFHVSPDQWAAIIRAAGAQCPGPSNQPFAHETKVRKAIELHAMRRAIEHYQAHGWTVADVSANQSFDLRCTRGSGEELRVEVKGTTTDGTQIILTRNEVAHARDQHPHVELFITSHIQITFPRKNDPQVGGGEDTILAAWYPEDAALSALSYVYTVPPNGQVIR